jgi:hypothetical protein
VVTASACSLSRAKVLKFPYAIKHVKLHVTIVHCYKVKKLREETFFLQVTCSS